MEILKDIVRQFYPLLIAVGCTLFVTGALFPTENGNEGVFKEAGSIIGPAAEEEEIKNEGMSFVGNTITGYVPVVKYAEGAKLTGDAVYFKSMFEVKKADGTVVNGSTEDTFTLYLLDIKNESGGSALAWYSTETLAEMEEIPAPFVYDKELDALYFFVSGTYTIEMKVYGANGEQSIQEFKLPVEQD